MTDTTAYKILTNEQWEIAKLEGMLQGSPVDLQDGYIHLSTAGQVAETAAKHYAGQDDLILLAVDLAALGNAISWEKSRGGALFPHLYTPLPLNAVIQTWDLILGGNGKHIFPIAISGNPGA